MKRAIDIDELLYPIPGDNPAGENLRYTSVYENIKEARRADDPLDRGDWQHELKTSDWDKVLTLTIEALTRKTKDLQIAAWLTEALIKLEGFSGLDTGLKVINGLLKAYWEGLYPEIEEGDLEFRMAPIEFLNDKLWSSVKEVPVTDKSVGPAYSWLKWQESRSVGYEADTLNQYGDVDENKKRARDEALEEGKVSGEEFDGAIARTSKAFYESLWATVQTCMDEFKTLDSLVDEKFGANAPRLAELKQALEDCVILVRRYLKEKGGGEPEAAPEAEPEAEAVSLEAEAQGTAGQETSWTAAPAGFPLESAPAVSPQGLPDTLTTEEDLWNVAVSALKAFGIAKALEQLLEASSRAPSIRDTSRYRLMMARLCLMAGRPDLARPIVEELHALIQELHLERWESPRWIAQVLDALYQCLMKVEQPSEEDYGRARLLFQQLCTTDVTKAIGYRF